jgi:hypothetical protein
MTTPILNSIVVEKPIKKKNAYLSRVYLYGKKPIKLNIPYGILKQSLLLSNKQGFQVEIRVPANDYSVDYMKTLEETCVNEMIKENKNWFKNGLSADKISSMIESCVSRNTSLHVYASNLRTSGLTDDGSFIPINEWFEKYSNIMSKVSLTLICDGLYIYPNKFGLRWVITEIQEYQEPEDIGPDIDELVAEWKEKIQTRIEEFEEKIQKLKNIHKNINSKNLDTEIEKLIEMGFSQNNFI